MSNVQIESVRHPFDDPRIASKAITALIRADAMGLLPRKITCLDDSAIRCLGTGLERADICRRFLPELRRGAGVDPAHLSGVLEEVQDALRRVPGANDRVASTTRGSRGGIAGESGRDIRIECAAVSRRCPRHA